MNPTSDAMDGIRTSSRDRGGRCSPIPLGLALGLALLLPPGSAVGGIVLDSLGRPLEGALVRTYPPLVSWARTDARGAFSLRPAPGAALMVAARGHETRHGWMGSPGDTIRLLRDPLLATDVLHIGFDDFRPGPSYSEDELKADIPVSYGSGFFDGTDPASDRASIDDGESVTGRGSSMKVRFPAGELKTASSGIDTRIPLAGTINANPFQADELFLSYWIKPDSAFPFHLCGGKLPSLGGSDVESRENQWKGRIMWRAGGSIQFYMELPHALDKIDHDSLRFWGEKESAGGSICQDRFTSYLKPGTWNNIELRYRLNTPGQDDGLFEGWVNGGEGHKVVNAKVFGNYRPAGGAQDKLTINAMLLSTFLGGSDSLYEPRRDTHAWFDRIRVSRTRIDEYHALMGTTTARRIPHPPNAGSSKGRLVLGGAVLPLPDASSWIVTDLQGRKIAEGTGSEIRLPKGQLWLVRFAPLAGSAQNGPSP